MSVRVASAAVATTQSRRLQAGKIEKVAREGDRYSRHASGLDDKQQHPSIQKCDRWVIGLAQVSVLTAHFGQRGRQFGPYKGAAHSDNPAKNPSSQDQRWGMHLLRHHVGIYEYAGTDDAAHDQHGDVEQPKLTRQAWLRSGCVIGARKVNQVVDFMVFAYGHAGSCLNRPRLLLCSKSR